MVSTTPTKKRLRLHARTSHFYLVIGADNLLCYASV